MNARILVLTVILTLAAPASAFAGPPVICHPIALSQPSLPWADTAGWNGALPAYDTAHLVADTLALLTPRAPVQVQMETLRRAAVYSARDPRLSDGLERRLLARWHANESDTTAFFDSAYFAEAAREMRRPEMQALLKH